MKSTQQLSTQFCDIKDLLDKCLSYGGGSYIAKTPGGAIHFRQRAYTFRKAYREAIAPQASPYDRLTLHKVAPGSCKVEISILKLTGEFIPGTEGPPAPIIEEDDPLLKAALALREKLDLD